MSYQPIPILLSAIVSLLQIIKRVFLFRVLFDLYSFLGRVVVGKAFQNS